MLIVVTYDVTDNKRRNTIASELKNYGARVQKSVFECHLEPDQIEEMKEALEILIDIGTDHIRFYPLCMKDYPKIEVAGTGTVCRDEDYFMI